MAEFDAGTVSATMTADTSGVHSSVERVKKDYVDLKQVIIDAMTQVNRAEREATQAIRDKERAEQQAAQKAKEAAQQQKQAAQQIKEGYQTLSVSSSLSFAAITAAIWKGIDANNQLKASMAGLDSIATGNIGSYEKIKKELEQIQADGIIPLTNATQAYKNLISRYKDEDIAIQMFHKIADAAAFGRQAHLSLGDAIQGTTEGLKNEMSQLTDNGGITKNLSAMWKDYATQIGKTVGVLTDAEKHQAEINGFMQEGRFQTGDLAKLQAQLAGQMAKANAETQLTAAALGDALEPAAREVAGGYSEIMKGVRELIQANPGLVAAVATGTLAFTGLLAVSSTWIALDMGAKIAAGFAALTGPVGLALIAIAALTAGIVGLATATAKAEAENEQFLNSYKSKADELGQKAKTLDTLITKYEDLKNKANSSKKAQSDLQDVIKQISQIAPNAVTKWGDLSTTIEISGTKAKQAVKDMLDARKALLEVALARSKYQAPQYQAVIDQNKGKVQSAEKELADVQKHQQDVYKKYADAQKWFYEYMRASDEKQSSMLKEGITKGFIPRWAAGNARAAYEAMNQEIQEAENQTVAAAKRLENIGKPYYDAQQKLAETNADIAEYNAILAKGAGLNTVPTKTTNTGNPPPEVDKRTPYDEAKDKFEVYAQTNRALESQLNYWEKIVGATKRSAKEEDDYQKKLHELRNQLKDASDKASNELTLARQKGLEKELTALNQSMEEELKTVGKGSQRELDIREKYRIESDKLTKKWNAETEAQQFDLQAALAKSRQDFETASIAEENARWKRELNNEELTKEQIEKINLVHEKNLLDIKKKSAGEKAAQDIEAHALAMENERNFERAEVDRENARYEREISAADLTKTQVETIEAQHNKNLLDIKKKHDGERKAQLLESNAASADLMSQYEQAEIDQENARYAREISVAGLTQTQLETMEKIHQKNIRDIRQKYGDERAQIQLKLRESEIDASITELEYQKILAELQPDQLKAQRDSLELEGKIVELKKEKLRLEIAELERRRQTAIDNKDQNEANRLQEQINQLKNQISQADNGYSATVKKYNQGIIDSWSNLIMGMKNATVTGESIWNDFTNNLEKQFLDMILKMAMESQILGTIFNGIGGVFGIGSMVGGGASPAAATVGGGPASGLLPTFHTGGLVEPLRAHTGWLVQNLRPDEVPLIAQTGERVLSRAQNAEYERGRGQSSEPQVIINQNVPGVEVKKRKQPKVDMKSGVKAIMLDIVATDPNVRDILHKI